MRVNLTEVSVVVGFISKRYLCNMVRDCTGRMGHLTSLGLMPCIASGPWLWWWSWGVCLQGWGVKEGRGVGVRPAQREAALSGRAVAGGGCKALFVC